MDRAVSAPTRFAWRAVFGDRAGLFVACFIVWTLTNLDQSLFVYSIPGILKEFALPLQKAGEILTLSFVFAPLPIVLAGLAADRFGRGTMLWFLLALSASFVSLQGLAIGFWSLTLFRALGFGTSGGLSPVTNSIVIDAAAPRFRGIAMGILQCGYPVGWFIASLIAAPVLSRYGWRFTCLSAVAVIPLAFLIGWLVRLGPAAAAAPPAPLSEAERAAAAAPAALAVTTPRPAGSAALRRLFSPELRWRTAKSMAMFFTFGGAYAGSASFFNVYFVQFRHYSESDAAWIVGLSNGVGIIGYLSAAFVGEFVLTRRNVFTLWCLGGAIALGGLLWASPGRTSDILWYAVMATFFFGTQAVIATFMGEIFPADIRTTALATCGSAPLTLGFAIFPSLVPGVIAALGWQWGLTFVVVPLLVGSALIAQTLPNVRSGLEAV